MRRRICRSWRAVSAPRVNIRSVPNGFVAAGADGDIHGAAFHLIEDGVLRITDIQSDRPDATIALVNASVDAARRAALEVACFAGAHVPGLEAALLRRGFALQPFLHLARPIAPTIAAPAFRSRRVHCETWDRDENAAAGLLFDAYQRAAALHFMNTGGRDEWRCYVRQLTTHPRCGTFDPVGSVMVRDATGLTGIALVTALPGDGAHLAQLAVRSDRRGQGLAPALIDAVLARAATAGRHSMTLLVDEGNRRARGVYDRFGFVVHAAFVAARLRVIAGPDAWPSGTPARTHTPAAPS